MASSGSRTGPWQSIHRVPRLAEFRHHYRACAKSLPLKSMSRNPTRQEETIPANFVKCVCMRNGGGQGPNTGEDQQGDQVIGVVVASGAGRVFSTSTFTDLDIVPESTSGAQPFK
jgi:hypothetical protein